MALSIQEYKKLKGLKKENLRDNMTNIELTLNQLAEVTRTLLSRQQKPDSFAKSKIIAKQGGQVAKNTRKDIENRLGTKIISPLNASTKNLLEVDINKVNKD